MKVYGVTYDHTINYGSSLQAYALQEAVRKIRVGGEVCEYELLSLSRTYKKPKLDKSLGWYVVSNAIYAKRFGEFDRKHMKYAVITKQEELPGLNEKADAFMCGSDVIWGTRYNGGWGAFYLDFALKYRFSYAPSIGEPVPDKISDTEAAWIARLDDVSCREESACRLIEQALGKRPALVVDPVLLLSREDWMKLAKDDKKKLPDHYIMVYMTYSDDTVNTFVDKLQKETGLPVIRAAWGASDIRKLGVLSGGPSPQRWVNLFANADYVVTNSFHGTAFSVLFHRRFFTYMRAPYREVPGNRLDAFLTRVGLMHRCLNYIPETIDLGPVDFTEADLVLERMIKESQDYLRRNLEKAWERKNGAAGKGEVNAQSDRSDI